ncbi:MULTISPECIES: hypothetical protein [Hyphobacterium]|uniref:Uncharacterized protein n=1 Tax=Hyphobacterium vulgare TaxID=1736751 RepID=A0ABV6ZZ78_9PROT
MLGWILGMMAGRAAGVVRTIVTVVCVMAAIYVLPPYIEPVIGPAIRQQTSPGAGEEIEAALLAQPVLAAYAEARPEVVPELRSRIEAAWQRGGRDAATLEAAEAGRELGARAVAEFAPYAGDAELIGFYRETYRVGRQLQGQPRICYSMFFGQINPSAVSIEDMARIDQYADMSALENVMTVLVRHAGDEIVEFDRARAEAAQAQVGMTVGSEFDSTDFRFFFGTSPEADEDYATACAVMLRLMEATLDHEDAALIIRIGMTQN